jgi:hypothetical protein
MGIQARRAMRRMKNHQRRMLWRADARLIRLLNATLARLDENTAHLARIEARGTPEQWQQLFRDMLQTFNAAAQTASVTRAQHEQLIALTQAYERLSLSLTQHHESSSTERREILDLMGRMDLLLGSLVSLERSQMRHLHDIGRAVGADQVEAELRRLQDVDTRDRRPEEK